MNKYCTKITGSPMVCAVSRFFPLEFTLRGDCVCEMNFSKRDMVIQVENTAGDWWYDADSSTLTNPRNVSMQYTCVLYRDEYQHYKLG
jgi:hypothetical protein